MLIADAKKMFSLDVVVNFFSLSQDYFFLAARIFFSHGTAQKKGLALRKKLFDI